MKITISGHSLGGKTARRRVLLLALLVAAVLTAAPFADDDLCFNTGGTPNIDGVVQGDGGWLTATQYVFGNGGMGGPHAVVQVARTASAAYMSFEINNDPTFDDLDIITIVLRPGGGATHDRRIHIFPVAQDVGNVHNAPGGPPREVKYWADSGTWNGSSPAVLPTWLTNGQQNIKVTSSAVLPLVSYVVEVKIPISNVVNDGVELPTSGPFGLYFNIVRVTNNGNDALGELHWPTTAPNVGGMLPLPIAVNTNTPLPATWGTGQASGPCAGVKVTSVSTNHPTDSNAIDPNSTNNRFTVNLQNSGTAAASGVTATVKSTRFGVSGSYGPLPVPPAGPTGTINPAGTTSVQTQAWDVLHDPNRATYLTWPNVCSIVELNATSGMIANRFFYWNLHFATASRFSHAAVIDARGLPVAPGESRQQFDLYVDERRQDFGREDLVQAAKLLGEDLRRGVDERQLGNKTDTDKFSMLRVLAQALPKQIEGLRSSKQLGVLTWLVHAYLQTGRFIEIEGKRYKVKDPVNSYGYVIVHEGLVANWKKEFTGPGLKDLGRGHFVVETPVGGETVITTTVEPEERGGRCGGLGLSSALALMGGLGFAGLFARRRRNEG